MVVINKEQGWIGHRLNILGIRVWRDNQCQLVAKTKDQWVTVGPPRSLPVEVPRSDDELVHAAHDPLLITAYQYMVEYPDSDLAGLLSKRVNFETVLNS